MHVSQQLSSSLATTIPVLLVAGYLANVISRRVADLSLGARWAYVVQVALAVVGTLTACWGAAHEDGLNGFLGLVVAFSAGFTGVFVIVAAVEVAFPRAPRGRV